jgi:hypothetical protein
MSKQKDPLEDSEFPDRLFYATGVLLDADDFMAEQTYHRGRLARVLAYLHGSGTVAGLKVIWTDDVAADPNADPPRKAREEEVSVEPGIAIDRLGRIIELPRRACIRLNRWFNAQTDDDLERAFQDVSVVSDEDGTTQTVSGVVADLFIRFLTCERGKTPAFAAGPFDALDAVAPSRLRDGYQLQLFLRDQLPAPSHFWPQDSKDLHDAIFGAWNKIAGRDEDRLKPLAEHAGGIDPTYVFLARLVLPAQSKPGERVKRDMAADVQVMNRMRPFVYTAGALARLSQL